MYIVSRRAFVGKYVDCRNMCGMNSIKFKNSNSKPGMSIRSHWSITELYYEDVN